MPINTLVVKNLVEKCIMSYIKDFVRQDGQMDGQLSAGQSQLTTQICMSLMWIKNKHGSFLLLVSL